MILGTIGPVPATKPYLQRNYVAGVVVGWFQHTIIQTGQYTILQEIPFGGYQIHIKFTDFFWEWNSSTWFRDNAIEFAYATPPGGGAPISFGNMDWVYKYAGAPIKAVILNLQLQPNDNHYTYYPAPINNEAYWLENPHAPSSPLQFNL